MCLKRAVLGLLFFFLATYAYAQEVTVAGFAFSGDYATAKERFPYTFKHFEEAKSNPSGSFSKLVVESMKIINNPTLTFNVSDLVAHKNRDKTLMAILVMNDEIVINDNFGDYYKTFINLRGNAMIFDSQSNTLVRNYPVSVVTFDATEGRTPPSDKAISGFIDNLIRRPDSGLIGQFVKKMEKAKLPKENTKTVQVNQGEISPDALAMMPLNLRNNPSAANAMLADAFASVLASRNLLAVLPNSVGHAAGTISMRLESGDDLNVKVGEGDYLFEVKLGKLVKKKLKETPAEELWAYGALIHAKFYEPMSNVIYFESDLKNSETAIIPVGKISGDDFAAYNDAIIGLFKKFSMALNASGGDWIGKAASAKDIETQLTISRNILENTK